jgi:hypothetical protein
MHSLLGVCAESKFVDVTVRCAVDSFLERRYEIRFDLNTRNNQQANKKAEHFYPPLLLQLTLIFFFHYCIAKASRALSF